MVALELDCLGSSPGWVIPEGLTPLRLSFLINETATAAGTTWKRGCKDLE